MRSSTTSLQCSMTDQYWRKIRLAIESLMLPTALPQYLEHVNGGNINVEVILSSMHALYAPYARVIVSLNIWNSIHKCEDTNIIVINATTFLSVRDVGCVNTSYSKNIKRNWTSDLNFHRACNWNSSTCVFIYIL